MKCKNCGAEVPSGEEKCPYCHCEMPKEKQEVHITNNYYRNPDSSSDEVNATTSTCLKCGSNKIKFKREEIGSTNAKVNKGKREVHYRTVGVCQNCGFTYDANPTPEKKKKHGFWWWVLVIIFFPISVPILLSKWFLKTDKIKLDKKIKIAIVAVFWILYLVLIFAGGGKNESTTTADTAIETTTKKETEAQTEVKTVKETEPETETEADVEQTVFGIGDTITQKDISVKCSTAILSNGGQFAKPDEDKYFLGIVFDISNDSNKDITISSLMSFEAYCDDYSTNIDLVGYQCPEWDGFSQLDGSVASGKKMNGVIVYQVPKDFKEFEIAVKPDFWSFKDSQFIFTQEDCDASAL